MSSDATRTEAAIQARRNSTEQMLARVRDALRQMRRDHIPVQTALLARRAEVSRTFLYQNGRPRIPAPERRHCARSAHLPPVTQRYRSCRRHGATTADPGIGSGASDSNAQRADPCSRGAAAR
jgi:hypothetical protein